MAFTPVYSTNGQITYKYDPADPYAQIRQNTSQTITKSSWIDDTTRNDMTVINVEELEELRADSKLLWAMIEEGVEEEWDGYERAVLRT